MKRKIELERMRDRDIRRELGRREAQTLLSEILPTLRGAMRPACPTSSEAEGVCPHCEKVCIHSERTRVNGEMLTRGEAKARHEMEKLPLLTRYEGGKAAKFGRA